MLPILLKLGPITIYAYGLFFAFGVFAGLYWFWKIGRDEHWEENILFDTYFIALFIYLVVGRMAYVMVHPELYNLGKAISILAYPGIVSSVGILAASIVVLLLARKAEWEEWKVMDGWVVVVSTVLVITSIGAILNGSLPGVVSNTFGYIHPGDTVARIPGDVWSFIWSLITFGIVSRVRKNFRFYAWYKGEASVAKDGLAALCFGVMVGGYYLIAGVMLEGSRLGVVPIMSLIGLGLVLCFSFMIYWRGGKNRGEVILARFKRNLS